MSQIKFSSTDLKTYLVNGVHEEKFLLPLIVPKRVLRGSDSISNLTEDLMEIPQYFYLKHDLSKGDPL